MVAFSYVYLKKKKHVYLKRVEYYTEGVVALSATCKTEIFIIADINAIIVSLYYGARIMLCWDMHSIFLSKPCVIIGL